MGAGAMTTMAKILEPLIGRMKVAGTVRGLAFSDESLRYEEGRMPLPDAQICGKKDDLEEAGTLWGLQNGHVNIPLRLRKDLPLDRIAAMNRDELSACYIPESVQADLKATKTVEVEVKGGKKGDSDLTRTVPAPRYTAKIGGVIDRRTRTTVPRYTKTFEQGRVVHLHTTQAIEILRDFEAGRFIEEVDPDEPQEP